MATLYRITAPGQLDLYRDEFLVGIRNIIGEQAHFPVTPEGLFAQLHEHLNHHTKGIWVVLDEGHLRCWASAKIYADEGRLTAAITYAWAQPGNWSWSLRTMQAIEAWARAGGADEIYCTRQTRIAAFERLMRRYGWRKVAVAFAKDFRQEQNLSLIHISEPTRPY